MPTSEKQPMATMKPRKPPLHLRLAHRIEDLTDDTNWIHVAFKICAFGYITFIAWIAWHVFPINGHWDVGRNTDRVPQKLQNLPNYFGSFKGFSQCGISALDIYSAPAQDERGSYADNAFCPDRRSLLRAMSNGGRIGFDAPYMPQGCHYRWYSVSEICMILERFDGLVFVGDNTLQSIYNGLNILLRYDLTNGALKTWSMTPTEKSDCKCDNQFTKPDCANHFVTSSNQVTKATGRTDTEASNAYVCDRTPHSFLQVGSDKLTQSTIDAFKQLVPKAPRSNYKPIPVIHSLSPTTATHDQASTSLLEFLNLADRAERKTPMLWIGPTAAGHIEIRGRKTNQEVWDFDQVVAKTAEDNDVEVLKMWNMTVQASSWDGLRFGEVVALVQAMMVVNWLGRLESS